MGFGLRWSGTLTWRSATVIFGGVGLLMVGFAARETGRLRGELRSWPRVLAHVDSATVTTPSSPRGDVYTDRLWLSYQLAERDYTTPVNDNVYSSGYGSAVRAAAEAARVGTIEAMVDPRNPRKLTIHPGRWGFYTGVLILGGLGLFFCGFGALFLAMWRREGGDHVSSTSWDLPRPLAFAFLGLMTAMFAGGGFFFLHLMRHQRTVWRPAEARIDSVDIVRQSSSSSSGHSDLYATRLWISYEMGGRAYHAPMVRGSYWSSYYGIARRAEAARREGTARVLVDPDDAYDVIAKPRGIGLIWLPWLFVAVGGVFLWVMVVAWRSPWRRSRTSRHARAYSG